MVMPLLDAIGKCYYIQYCFHSCSNVNYLLMKTHEDILIISEHLFIFP